jgi:PAS domain S-box-containing protein
MPAARSVRHRAGKLGEWALVLAALLAGGAGTWLLHWAVRSKEALQQREYLSAMGQSVHDAFDLELTRTVEAVRAGSLMASSRPQLDRQEFEAFCRGLMTDLKAMSFMEWQPVVSAAQRDAFEASARQAGLPGFQITDPQGDHFVRAPARAEYLPVLFAWPLNTAANGLDLAPYPTRMASKYLARDSGLPVASEVFKVIDAGKASDRRMGLAISAATYQAHAQVGTAVQRRQALRGYVAGVVHLQPLFQDAVLRADGAHLDMLVVDLTAQPHQLIHGEAAGAGGPGLQPGAQDFAFSVNVAQRTWQIILRPRPAFFQRPSGLDAGAALLVGLLATLLLAATLFWLQRSRNQLAATQAATAQAERALADERQRLSHIIDGTQAGTWEWNVQTGETRINERWAQIVGYTMEELAVDNTTWPRLCHPDDLAYTNELKRRHFSGELPFYDCELRMRHKQGHWVWVLARGYVSARTPDGQPLWMSGTHLEISERKQAEEALHELNNTLEQRVRQRGEQLEAALGTLHRSQEELTRSEARATIGTLVASVSHEMNTPLGNGLMAASTLAERARQFQRQVQDDKVSRSGLHAYLQATLEGAQLVQRNLERTVELVRNFRQVAADQASERRRSFDLAAMVREVLDTLAPSLKNQPHQVSMDIPPGITLDSYPGPLGQVIINLVNNAYLHAFEGRGNGQVAISATLQGQEVLLQVSDNGCGMSPEHLAQVLKPFFSTRIGQGGTGLGLTIVDNLVRKSLGGTLHIASTPGAGTRFDIRLPLVAPASDAAAS